MKQTIKFITFYTVFYLSGMTLHFIFQKFMGDQFASMNLFVVAISAMTVSSLKEFKEQLTISNMLVASSIAAFLNYGLLLILPFVSRFLEYPSGNANIEAQEILLIIALNFSACLIVLRLGNKHWGLTSSGTRKLTR